MKNSIQGLHYHPNPKLAQCFDSFARTLDESDVLSLVRKGLEVEIFAKNIFNADDHAVDFNIKRAAVQAIQKWICEGGETGSFYLCKPLLISLVFRKLDSNAYAHCLAVANQRVTEFITSPNLTEFSNYVFDSVLALTHPGTVPEKG